jgi:peptide deformylase
LNESELNRIIKATIIEALADNSDTSEWSGIKEHLQQLVVDMYELSDHTGGVGLSACDYIEKAIDELSKFC